MVGRILWMERGSAIYKVSPGERCGRSRVAGAIIPLSSLLS